MELPENPGLRLDAAGALLFRVYSGEIQDLRLFSAKSYYHTSQERREIISHNISLSGDKKQAGAIEIPGRGSREGREPGN